MTNKFLVKYHVKYNGKYYKPKSILKVNQIDRNLKGWIMSRVIVPLNNKNETIPTNQYLFELNKEVFKKVEQRKEETE